MKYIALIILQFFLLTNFDMQLGFGYQNLAPESKIQKFNGKKFNYDEARNLMQQESLAQNNNQNPVGVDEKSKPEEESEKQKTEQKKINIIVGIGFAFAIAGFAVLGVGIFLDATILIVTGALLIGSVFFVAIVFGISKYIKANKKEEKGQVEVEKELPVETPKPGVAEEQPQTEPAAQTVSAIPPPVVQSKKEEIVAVVQEVAPSSKQTLEQELLSKVSQDSIIRACILDRTKNWQQVKDKYFNFLNDENINAEKQKGSGSVGAAWLKRNPDQKIKEYCAVVLMILAREFKLVSSERMLVIMKAILDHAKINDLPGKKSEEKKEIVINGEKMTVLGQTSKTLAVVSTQGEGIYKIEFDRSVLEKMSFLGNLFFNISHEFMHLCTNISKEDYDSKVINEGFADAMGFAFLEMMGKRFDKKMWFLGPIDEEIKPYEGRQLLLERLKQTKEKEGQEHNVEQISMYNLMKFFQSGYVNLADFYENPTEKDAEFIKVLEKVGIVKSYNNNPWFLKADPDFAKGVLDKKSFIAKAKTLLAGKLTEFQGVKVDEILGKLFDVYNYSKQVRREACSWREVLETALNIYKAKKQKKETVLFRDLVFDVIEKITKAKVAKEKRGKKITNMNLPSVRDLMAGNPMATFSSSILPGRKGPKFNRFANVFVEEILGARTPIDKNMTPEISGLIAMVESHGKEISIEILDDISDENAFMSSAIMNERDINGQYHIVISKRFYEFLKSHKSGKGMKFLEHKIKEELDEIYNDLRGPITDKARVLGEVHSTLFSLNQYFGASAGARLYSQEDLLAFAELTGDWISEIDLQEWQGYLPEEKAFILEKLNLLKQMYLEIARTQEAHSSVTAFDVPLVLSSSNQESIDNVVFSSLSTAYAA